VAHESRRRANQDQQFGRHTCNPTGYAATIPPDTRRRPPSRTLHSSGRTVIRRERRVSST
jgi:hypothetical protein